MPLHGSPLAALAKGAGTAKIWLGCAGVVIAGLDPAIHHSGQKRVLFGMDARVIWREDALRAFARARRGEGDDGF
jgi:hypothetical protein